MSSYQSKLTSPKWQKKRLKIFERDGFKCTYCGNTEQQLEVHHLDYIPGIKPEDYPDDMLTTICRDCHDKEQGRDKLEQNLATAFKIKGYLAGDLLALSCLLHHSDTFSKHFLRILREHQKTEL